MSDPRQQARDLVRQREQGGRQRTPSPPRSGGTQPQTQTQSQSQSQSQSQPQSQSQGQIPAQRPAQEQLPRSEGTQPQTQTQSQSQSQSQGQIPAQRPAQEQLPKEPIEDAGPNKLSSSNWNAYVTSPYSPLTNTGGGLDRNPKVDTISAFSVQTIEILSNLNIATPNTFAINGDIIVPSNIHSGDAIASIDSDTRTFLVEFTQNNPIFEVQNTQATFQNPSFPYTLNVFGKTNTQQLAVGSPFPTVPTGYVAALNGNVVVNGTVTSTGTFDLSGLQVNTLGVKQLLDVSGQTVLSGSVTAKQGVNVTGNSYIIGNLGINNTTPTVALDVVGTANISQTLNVTGATNLKGAVGITGNLDVSGSSRFYSSTSISSLNVSNNTNIAGDLSVIGPVSGGTMTGGTVYIGIPYSSYPNPGVAAHEALYAYGQSHFYDDIESVQGSLFITGNSNQINFPNYIKEYLVINNNRFQSTPYNLEVVGTTHITGQVVMDSTASIAGTLDSRNQVIGPILWSAFSTLSNQSTTYIVNCEAASRTLIIPQTGGAFRVGVSYYFAPINTGAGGLSLRYYSADNLTSPSINPITTASVSSGKIITLICVAWDGTNNQFAAST